jgi:hypothetical protein
MRASQTIAALIVLALVVTVGLALTGKLPWLTGQWDGLAFGWQTDTGDAGPVDAGRDAAVKVQAGPLSSAQLSAPLYHVTFLAECGAPPDMKVSITATVKMGRAVDARATTDPRDPVIEGCIERATQALQWPASRKTDKVTVRY